MARGWDSKSVESQIETARSDLPAAAKKRLTPEMAETLRKRQSLLLARTRVLQQIEASQNPRHRALMEKALADLEILLAGTKPPD